MRRTLEKELTRAILDGKIPEGTRIVAREGDEQTVVLDLVTAEEPVTV
jgi:hypothetical protein